jgi:hypothetical protein
VLLCVYRNGGVTTADESWSCTECGDLPVNQQPNPIENTAIERYQRFLRVATVARPELPIQLEQLIESLLTVLAPAHYVLCEAYMELATLHASSAAIYERMGNRKLCDDSRLASAKASLHVCRLLECVCNKCMDGITQQCSTRHLPHKK